MKIISPAFDEGDWIPVKHTCDSLNVSPPLKWSDVPKATKSFALLCEDPDAPMGTWVHWLIYNIPESIREMPENVPPIKNLPNGAIQGRNDFRKIGYGGPCPPMGTHHYSFKIFALDIELKAESEITRPDLLKAMHDHIIGEAHLMGKCKRLFTTEF